MVCRRMQVLTIAAFKKKRHALLRERSCPSLSWSIALRLCPSLYWSQKSPQRQRYPDQLSARELECSWGRFSGSCPSCCLLEPGCDAQNISLDDRRRCLESACSFDRLRRFEREDQKPESEAHKIAREAQNPGVLEWWNTLWDWIPCYALWRLNVFV